MCFGNEATGDVWFGSEATGDVWFGNEATGSVWFGNEATGDVWFGNEATGDVWFGNEATGDVWFGNEATGDVWFGNEATSDVWFGNEATDDFTARRWVKDFEQTPTSWSIFSASLIDLSGMPRVRLVPLTTAMISFRLIIPSRFVSKVSAIFSSSICVIASPGQRRHANNSMISSLLFQKF